MGRFYDGDIEGKFWVGIQSSLDALTFGGTHHVQRDYACCNCSVEEVYESPYCRGCYDSLHDHYEKAMEAEEIETMDDSLIRDSGYATVSFEGDQLEEVRGHINVLYEQVGRCIWLDSVKIGNSDNGYEIEFELKEEEITQKGDDMELLARYFLARQVEACLADKGSCSFNCEL